MDNLTPEEMMGKKDDELQAMCSESIRRLLVSMHALESRGYHVKFEVVTKGHDYNGTPGTFTLFDFNFSKDE